MNENIEQLRSKYNLMNEEERRLLGKISSVHSEKRMIVGEYIKLLNIQFAKYLNKKVTIERYDRKEVIGFFCGFRQGYNDLNFEAYVDLAKIKKDGLPSAIHYPFYDTVEFRENLKITLCDE